MINDLEQMRKCLCRTQTVQNVKVQPHITERACCRLHTIVALSTQNSAHLSNCTHRLSKALITRNSFISPIVNIHIIVTLQTARNPSFPSFNLIVRHAVYVICV